MIKKIYGYIITGLSILTLSCPTLCNAIETPKWGFGAMFGVGGVDVYGTEKNQEDSLIYTIRNAINWVLALLSFICVCLVIYAGFLMLTSGGDNKRFGEGFTIIKNAGIGLTIIAVSWLIVSLIFYLINTNVETI